MIAFISAAPDVFFPAFFVTLAATFLSAGLLFSPDHLRRLAQSTVFAALAVSNFYFWQEAGYWDLKSTLKPLLHTWSLSVEEQFYLVWPAILVGAGIISRRRSLVAQVLLLAGAASFALAAMVAPPTAFYLMPCRVFEFAIGAFMVGLSKPASLPQAAAQAIAAAGLILVLYAVLAFTSETPVAAMLVPCLGTAMLIFAGPKPTSVSALEQQGCRLGRTHFIFALSGALATDRPLSILAI